MVWVNNRILLAVFARSSRAAPQPSQDEPAYPGALGLDEPPNLEQAALGAGEKSELDDEEYGDDEGSADVDPWDIQTAIDPAISALMKDGLISELGGKNAPSLSEVFGFLFGDDDDTTKQVEYFEELIAGYEDRVVKGDLEEAHSVLLDVFEKLKKSARRQRRA